MDYDRSKAADYLNFARMDRLRAARRAGVTRAAPWGIDDPTHELDCGD